MSFCGNLRIKILLRRWDDENETGNYILMHRYLLKLLFLIDSSALWKGSNSKIENYGCSTAVALFMKVRQPFLAC